MNNVTLAHIGGEIVLIGGVAFYFHRKTGKLREDITALQKENADLREAVEELSNQIQQLGNMVMQMRQSNRHPVSIVKTSPTQSLPQKKRDLPAKKVEHFEEETVDEAELDKEISEELEELKKSRKEENCDDGVCKLIDD